MFFHILKYRLKCMVKDRAMMFWTLLFPVILGTFFNLAFSNISQGEMFQTIPVAVIDNEAYRENENLIGTFEELSSPGPEGEKPLLKVLTVSDSEAKTLLENRQIAGFIEFGDTARVTVMSRGINQTILKNITDSILRTEHIAREIILSSDNPEQAAENFRGIVSREGGYFIAGDKSDINPDFTLIFYYALIGMACFYGSYVGLKEVNAIQADLSDHAKRINVAPTKKIKTFFTSAIAASIIQLFSIFFLLAYLNFIIGVDFGGDLLYVSLLCIAGCLCGVSFGTMVGVLVKGSEGIKTAILTGASMLLSFMAGLMMPEVKYSIARNFPVLSYINPVNAITDALYALYYYPEYTRFFINMGILTGFIVLFSSVTILRLRRLRYASV